MPTNSWIFLVAGLFPLLIGMIYYSKFLFGNKWMKLNGFTEEGLKSGNMLVIFGVTYIFSVIISFFMSGLVVHQPSVYQMMIPEVLDANGAAAQTFNQLMEDYGHKHRNVGHGLLHGVMVGALFAFPLIGINALFERRGWAYIFIHVGYWVLSLAAIGAFICPMIKYT